MSYQTESDAETVLAQIWPLLSGGPSPWENIGLADFLWFCWVILV